MGVKSGQLVSAQRVFQVIISGASSSVPNMNAFLLHERKPRQAEIGQPQNHLFSMVDSGDTRDSEPLWDLLEEIREGHTRTAHMGPQSCRLLKPKPTRASHTRIHLQGDVHSAGVLSGLGR